MRIDIVSIFPDYFAPLQLSLLGRARSAGLLDLHTHDLRQWARDRHHTVDDTPYGGGAGMVMKPGPWGEAIDALLANRADRPRLVVPTPAGTPLNQAMAERLAAEPWLMFACGRYEGIDQRVVDHYSRSLDVDEVSIGDFVVNGGEVAAMVIIEAVARLVPGFLGNQGSLTEESHATGGGRGLGGLLEYPVFTKPVSWRGHDVPPVLLSGHHADIAAWRRDRALRRTARRRPDLLHPSEVVQRDDLGSRLQLSLAEAGDAAELLTLQRSCWVSEARANDAFDIPPLIESLADVRAALQRWTTWVLRAEGRLVGSVRARQEGDRWLIGRLMVALDLQGRGLGQLLLEHAEQAAPAGVNAHELFTGPGSADNIRRYRKAGYRPVSSTSSSPPDTPPGMIVLRKERRA